MPRPSRRIATAATLAVVALVVLVGVALAQSNDKLRSGQTVTIPAGETVTSDLYVFAGTVRVEGTIDGDLVAMGGTIVQLCEGTVGPVERGHHTNSRYDPAARAHKRQAARENASDHHCGRHGFFGAAALFRCIRYFKCESTGSIAGDTTAPEEGDHPGRQLVRSVPYIESTLVRLGFIGSPCVIDKGLIWKQLVLARPVLAEAVKNVCAVQRKLHDTGRSAGKKHGSERDNRLGTALGNKLIHNQRHLRVIRIHARGKSDKLDQVLTSCELDGHVGVGCRPKPFSSQRWL